MEDSSNMLPSFQETQLMCTPWATNGLAHLLAKSAIQAKTVFFSSVPLGCISSPVTKVEHVTLSSQTAILMVCQPSWRSRTPGEGCSVINQSKQTHQTGGSGTSPSQHAITTAMEAHQHLDTKERITHKESIMTKQDFTCFGKIA